MNIEDRDRLVSVLIQRSYELGASEAALVWLQRAERHCRTMVELRPSRLLWLNRWAEIVGRIGGMYARLGFHSEAIRTDLSALDRLRPALAVWPTEPEMLRRAVISVRSIVQNSAKTSSPSVDVDRLFDEGVKWTRAMESATTLRAAAFDQGHRLFVDRGRHHLANGRVAAALEDAASALRLLAMAREVAKVDKIQVSNEPQAYLLQIEALLRLGRVDEAAAVVAQSLPAWHADAFDIAPKLREYESDPRFARAEQLRKGR
jgi:tetratricopeptide (TPR) repeat protein